MVLLSIHLKDGVLAAPLSWIYVVMGLDGLPGRA
jgi:hypothetical protein